MGENDIERLDRLKERRAKLEVQKRIMLLELKTSIELLMKCIELAEEGFDVKDKIIEIEQDIAKRLGLQCSIDERNSIWDLEKQLWSTTQEIQEILL